MKKIYYLKITDNIEQEKELLIKRIINFWRQNFIEFEMEKPEDIENYKKFKFENYKLIEL